MYCLDKLQRELTYYFSKDIRELPKVEDLLAEAGYTQIRKGDEIIEIDSALGKHSGDSISQILESQATKEAPSTHTPPTPPTLKGLFDEVDSSEIIFTDKKGKEHTLTKEVQEQWLETFNLKSLDESYTPKLPQELADTLGKEIRLTKGSLYKIVEKGREQYIPQIKETLEKPQIVLQDESELIFAKQIKDDLYLTSIGKDFDTHITIISNSPKTDKTIQNKLKNGKMIYKAENAEALPTSGAFTETNQVPFSNNTIPQKPKNSEPEKVLEYFRDDLIRGYNKALEAFEGKRPLVSTIPYKALDPIIEAKTALVKEANDGFKKILQKAGFPDDVIQEKFMKSLNFGDIDYNLRRIREYFGQVEKNLHQYYETHKPIVEKLLKQKDEAIRLYESRLPAEQELHKKRILLSRFMENARVYGSKEHKLLDNFIDEIEAKKGLLESTQATLAPKKSLFDEVETSVESQATHQDYNTFNQSLKDAHDFFKANNKDPYNDKLFNDVIKVANALDIRFWYQPNAVWMGGSYTYTLNRIMLRSKDFSEENAKTMLHELIHSVTSRAIYAYENKALRAKLSKEQIEAITELKNLYKEVSENNADKVWKKMATFRDEVENNKGKLYGLKNEHEMLAELANPTFREFLKEQNIFSKIVEAMAKIFSYVKDKLTGESVKSTNAQSELESILYKIMDSYTNPHAFTNEMSEHFGSRNFVDTTRYKEYIKDHKEKFDKDNYKGKHLFSFFDNSMNLYTKSALGGRENFFKTYINNAYFDEKDFDIVQKLKWQMMDPVKRPTNFMELKTEKNAHIFQYIEQAQENNIKDFVKEYYGVSYEEFNNAFNGAMKDKHFYEAKQFTYKNYEDIPSKETAFLLALKPYFTSGLYKTLSEADFNVIKDNLYRILQDENLTYRNKPINEWLAKEWVEQDVKALQESFLYKLEQPPLQATQNALESTQKAQAIKELYHRYGEESLKDLFDKVLSAAGDVKFSIRQTYANANGKYSADKHLITLNRRWALDIEPQRLAQTLLHELIHATIARAQYHHFSPQAFPELAHKLTPAQKAAVQEIDDLYILAFKTHQAQKRAKTLADDELELYGFTNSKEFVAELANPKFRSYLEKQNIFKRVLEAIVKFFTGGGGEQTSILKALQESYEKFLDNFGERSESFFGKKEGGASPSESRTLFDKADSSESFSYTTGKAKGIAELRKDLKAALEPSLNKEIVNKEQGLSGVITTEEVKKIMSSKAVAKSVANGFSRDEHIEVAKHIERLFTESKLLRSHKDYKENPNILQVHRFVKDIQVNGKEANALITLFEKMQGKNKIYTIELESLENLPPLSTQAKSAETAVKAQSAAATPTEAAPIAKTDEQIVAQDSNALLESTMQKFNYDERKAKDLLEWHKDSSPLTKDENGVPKVFYHGTSADELFEVFSPKKDSTKWGFWFASGEDYADHYGKGKYGTRQEPLKFSTFLKVKNPFDMTDDKNLEVLKKIMGKKEYEAAAKEVDFDHDNGASKIYRILSYSPFDRYKDKARAFQNKLKKLGYDGIKEQDGVMIVFEPNQIKHIENRGVAGRYFYSSSPNIFHSNPHAGAGLLGGSVAGIETDENGNITFNPEKFALGLLGGAVGSKAVAQGFKYLKENPQVKEAVARELANTLALGFDKARQKYPALNLLEPRRIIQNEKGRAAQARNMLKSAEKQSRAMQLKTRKTLKKYNIESLEIAQEQEYRDFVSNVWDKKGYEKAPNILKIAVLPQHLQAALRVKFSEVFLTKKDLSHFRTARKQHYNQALSEAEILEIPSVITHAKTAYIDTQHKNFFIVFDDKIDSTKLNFIHFNTDELGNYIITTKKADRQVLNNKQYKQVGSGIEPHIP